MSGLTLDQVTQGIIRHAAAETAEYFSVRGW